MVTFCLSHSDPNSAFQPITKMHVLYVYIIQQFVSAALPRPGPWLYALQARKGKRSGAMLSQNVLFFSKICFNIT